MRANEDHDLLPVITGSPYAGPRTLIKKNKPRTKRRLALELTLAYSKRPPTNGRLVLSNIDDRQGRERLHKINNLEIRYEGRGEKSG